MCAKKAGLKVPVERLRRWSQLVGLVEEFAVKASQHLNGVVVVLYGSVARGDFNLWSDIDLLVISPAFRGVKYRDRYTLIQDILPAGVEPVLYTPEELSSALSKPAWKHALNTSYIVRDDLGLAHVFKRACITVRRLTELRKRIEELTLHYASWTGG